ncbi:etoposide-induced protein 2.4 homolog [Clytia hemisphaerica]|uniref:Uncharacterized protein n=1 Tax=Clytia hemisphaerica TaxID=252671 RepID=A0A7M5VF57_9CNID|eukprot:TCONS_00017932-protein
MNTIAELFLGCLLGLKDSILGLIVLTKIDSEEKERDGRPPSRRSTRQRQPDKKKVQILPLLAQSCLLNGGALLVSVLVFEGYIIPAVQYIMVFVSSFFIRDNGLQSSLWSYVEPVMKYTFQYLWVIPLFWLSKILNCIWFVEIADGAYRKKYGRPVSSLISSKDNIFKVISKSMADFLFSILVEIFFLIQAQLVGLIPVFGTTLLYVHMSLLYSLYAFEYTWSNLGWTVVRRVGFIETYWPYFTGFGFLLSVLTYISTSTIASAGIFGTVFPVFILSALEAKPHEECEYPLRLFSLVIWLTNKLFLFRSPVKSKSSTETNK